MEAALIIVMMALAMLLSVALLVLAALVRGLRLVALSALFVTGAGGLSRSNAVR